MNEEMKEAILIQCLDDLEMGMSVADILARYPEYAADIQPILRMATELTSLSQEPTPGAQDASRELFLAHADAMRQVQRRPQQRIVWWRRLVVGLSLFVLLFVGTITTFEASAAALPGDVLYPVKLTRENLQLALTRDELTADALREQFQDERALEIKALLDLGREREATCEGLVVTIDVQIWHVCGLDVVVDATTAITGQANVGSRVLVHGLTRSNTFVATAIEVLDAGVPPTPTVTNTPLATGTATETAVPTHTPSPTVERTPPPTITSTPIEHDEVEDGLTPEPADEDDDSHNTPPAVGDDDDNGGDSGGDDNSGSGSGDDGGNQGGDDGGSSGNDGGDDNSGSGSGDDGSNSGGDDGGDDHDDGDDGDDGSDDGGDDHEDDHGDD
ncbi:MAG: hypothetical protein KC443_17635 [Anaerolineales bacterium]|nr:hypothetical protein [Anaerolineales bacterium]